MKKITDADVMEVVKKIYERSFGWPDGTQLCGMDSERVNDAMVFIMDRMTPVPPKVKNGTTFCKKCGNHLKKIGLNVRDNFCGKCGQAVMWEKGAEK